MSIKRSRALPIFAALFALPLLAACDDQGPAETLGEKIDKGANQAAETVDDAVDEAQKE